MAFKVMCINENWKFLNKPPEHDCPVCGEVYTVVAERFYKEAEFYTDGWPNKAALYYELFGFAGLIFISNHFATLPEDDSDKMKEETREAIVNLEHA